MDNRIKSKFRILAIESSCDETAASVIEVTSNQQQVTRLDIVTNIVSSQVKLHAAYGGVYPELASREHIRNIIPVIQKAIAKIPNPKHSLDKLETPEGQIPNKFQFSNNQFQNIDAIAVTTGPGLIGSLLVGVNTAKTLAYTLKKPIYAINHLEGHVYSCLARENINSEKERHPEQSEGSYTNKDSSLANEAGQNDTEDIHNSSFVIHNSPKFPILALIVSGGHTSLVLMKDHFNYQTIGETLDDAAGEVFDKVARMLDLGYPGGPAISQMANGITNNQTPITKQIPIRQLADKSQIQNPSTSLGVNKLTNQPYYAKATQDKPTNESTFSFPRPMIDSDNFNFSFSGLKTAVLYAVNKLKNPSNILRAGTRTKELRNIETKEQKNKETNNQKTNQPHYAKATQDKPINQLTKQLICYEFQEAVVETLVTKTLKAAQKYKVKSILLCGGVSANSRLQEAFKSALSCHPEQQRRISSIRDSSLNVQNDKPLLFIPEKSLTGDNATMIGIATAYRMALGKKPTPWYDVNADPNLKLG